MKTFQQFLSEERVDPASYSLPGLFRTLNQQLFNSELDNAIPIAWGRVPKNAAGITNGRAIRHPNTPIFMRKTVPGSIAITISPYVYEEDVLKGIVAHEMIHAYLMQTNRHDREAHGNYFTNMQHRLNQIADFNIPLSHTMEDNERGEPKLVAFIAGATKEGKEVASFFQAKLAQDREAVMNADISITYLMKHAHFKWCIFGLAKTAMANTVRVAREIKQRGINLYHIPAQQLQVTQRIIAQGPHPF